MAKKTLLYMTPFLTPSHLGDVARRYAKGFSQLCKGFSHPSPSSNLSHIFDRKPGVPVSLSARQAAIQFFRPVIVSRPSSLTNHVSDVVLIGAQKKVTGVDAERIVASVTDEHFIGEVPIENHVRNTVRQVATTVDSESPVSATPNVPTPNPTSINIVGAINVRPKSFKLFCGKVKVHSVLLALSDVAGTVSAVSGYFLANNSTFRAYYYG